MFGGKASELEANPACLLSCRCLHALPGLWEHAEVVVAADLVSRPRLGLPVACSSATVSVHSQVYGPGSVWRDRSEQQSGNLGLSSGSAFSTSLSRHLQTACYPKIGGKCEPPRLAPPLLESKCHGSYTCPV